MLLYSEVLAEKRTFAEQFVVTGLREGETCFYLDLFRSPQLARREFAKFGDIPHDRLVVGGVPSPADARAGGSFGVEGVPEPEAILSLLRDVLEERHPRRVILDSLDLLAEQLAPAEFERFLHEFLGTTTDAGVVVGLLFVEWGHAEGEVPAFLDRSDYRIEFRSTVQEGGLVHKLRVRKGGAKGRTTRWIPFGFREGRGVILRFPRVLVAGLQGSGKSSFVQAASQPVKSLDRVPGGVALDYGQAARPGVEIELLGVPGQERFAFLLPVLTRGTSGLVLVVDSTRPEQLEEAANLRALVGPEVPAVVVANKRDLAGALPVRDIRRRLRLGEEVPILEAVANRGEGVAEALETLIDLMVWGWSAA